MTKKSKKKRPPPSLIAKSNVVAVESAGVPQRWRLAHIQSLARAHIENKAWTDALALAQIPLTAIHEDDRQSAQVWLLRLQILALYPPGVQSRYDLAKEAREELETALKQLAVRVESLHTLPEFDIYIDSLNWSIEDCAQALHRLSRACSEATNIEWLRKLRARALRLLRAQENPGEELTVAEQQALSALANLPLVLSNAYTAAKQSGALDAAGHALVDVLRHELNLIQAGPGNHVSAAEPLLRLQSPSESELVALPVDESEGAVQQRLTPRGWAFIWMLEYTAGEDYADLLEQFPEPFADNACEGLRRVVCALSAAAENIEAHLSLAVQCLMRFADEGTHWFGTYLKILGQGPCQIYVGQPGLRMASVDDLLWRLYEQAPVGFSRRAELQSLYRIFAASIQFSPLEDEAHGDQDMPGLAWLCEQSISFQFAAANVVQGVAGRMRLLLDAMRRTILAGVPPQQNYYAGDFDGEELDEPQARLVLDALGRLAAVRGQMDKATRSIWLQVAGDIFNALSKVSDEVRTQLLPLARAFSDDLLEVGHAFRLAYLEQVVGDPQSALSYYLIDIETAEPLSEVGMNNAKLLWARSSDLEQIQSFLDKLQEQVTRSSRADVVKQLLADAKARLATLNKRDQFERTAVSRWPSLTAPARKLLTVFASIKTYKGLAEVAEYAGMELTWAKRHYDKLVDLGMLLVTDTTFRVNPHIAPLLEREAQHAVIGRIVRAQGTSAVKQVFNSQREFSIYQVLVQLCPNHLVFPNCSLQSIMSYERMKELVSEDDFGYYLRASVDIVVVSSTMYLPMLAIEVDSVWHDTERQQRNDDKKDRLFAAAGIPFIRLRPVGSPSENTIRAQVAQHVDELVRSLRADLPGYEQARGLLEDLSCVRT
ncbi:DUF2726 domain-containing protein [Bordetella genomosp. 9]|uniref:DUF2726 domain-containing protein n=1 Tax=Bordetella genomosp. 9 TaxID=1416803 RepID=A0A1W6Z001_9BORD|nr:DUF2726 domain-containing protein [Bordetella genomosp. 9]ARP86648.1 hypothetical protein CAL13_10835 [Bordetella genomosp. 9]